MRSRLRRRSQHACQLLDRGSVAGKLRQGVFPQQGGRQTAEQVARALAGPQDGPSPEADPFHHAKLHEHRQHAGPHERGLAGTADSQNQEKGATLGRLPLEAFQGFADRPRAAEENGVVFELEGLQAAEGTARGPRRPYRILPVVEADAEPLQSRLDQLAKMVFQPGLEVGRVFKRVERGDQRAVLAVEEPPHELIEQLRC